VIDRTFVEHGVRWIIDYKTGIHHGTGAEAFLDNEEARYRAQMETYALVMSRIDSRPIRLGLYFPLLCGWREWSFHTWRAHPSPATVA
jgi:ATP-dependent exoDNAse (exonuclease V) beta subunit